MSGSYGKRREGGKSVGRVNLPRVLFLFLSLCLLYGGTPAPESHRGGRGISFVVADRPRAGSWVSPLLALL